MGNTVPVQSEKQQSPKQSGHLPPEPAMSKGMPVQMRLSTPPTTKQCTSNAPGPASSYVPSQVPLHTEDKTFMFATRHVLENALGKETLEHLEALLQQEKKLTQDYIEQLEEAVKQNSGIGSQMQSKLVQKQVAHWKAKAEGHNENIKTEMKLLRDWNVRVKEEKDNLEVEVKQLRQENRMLRTETEQLKGGQGNEQEGKEYEIKRLRMRNAQLEAEKDATNTNFQMMQEDLVAFKAEIERMKNDSAPEQRQEEFDIEMKDSHDEIASGNASAPASVGKNHQRNLKRRAREKKRCQRALVQENRQLSAKLAQLESEYSTAHTETLAVNEERLVKLQQKIEKLEQEMRLRDERAERCHHTPAPAPVVASTPISASKRKAKKRNMKKEQKKKEEMRG